MDSQDIQLNGTLEQLVQFIEPVPAEPPSSKETPFLLKRGWDHYHLTFHKETFSFWKKGDQVIFAKII